MRMERVPATAPTPGTKTWRGESQWDARARAARSSGACLLQQAYLPGHRGS